MRYVKLLVKVVVSAVMLATLALAIVLAAWRASGGRVLSVQTASMLPLLRPGDAVMVQKVTLSQLQPDDVVSYRSLRDARMIVSHRVVKLDAVRRELIVQGDNLALPDPAVPESAIVGRVGWYIPRAGRAMDILQQPTVVIPAIIVVAVVIVGLELRQFSRHYMTGYYKLST